LRALENRWRRWSKTARRRREREMRARESLENDERERESLACLMLINKPEEDDGITGQFNHSTHLCRTHPAAATSSNASPRAPRQIFEAWHFTLYQAQDPGDDQGRILQQPLHWILSTSNQFTRNRPGSPLRDPTIGYPLW
jgi:hypothetical protein